MNSSWMLRAAAAPERFLDRGFTRLLSRPGILRRPKHPASAVDLGVVLPVDLARFMSAVSDGAIADFVSRPCAPSLASLLASARRGGTALARLTALFAGAVPFGETRAGEIIIYFLADAPARGVIAAIEPRRMSVRLVCRGAAELAVIFSFLAAGQEPPSLAVSRRGASSGVPPSPPSSGLGLRPRRFGIADEEAVSALVDRARSLALVVAGSDAQVRTAMRALALKPLDVPPPERPVRGSRGRPGRTTPLALGAMVEAFFRETTDELKGRLEEHTASSDAIAKEASALLLSSLGDGRRTAAAKELGRRRALALRALRAPQRLARLSAPDPMETTREIVARFDTLPPNAESFSAVNEREETLLALTKLGDRRIAPTLLARALTGDAGAVDMLAALGDRSLLPHLGGLLDGEPSRIRLLEAAVVRTLVATGAKEALPALRKLLDANPMTGWREGLERVVLVRELVSALGELEDSASAASLVAILDSTSQEYRAVLPMTAYALGRLRHVPALGSLERLLFSPKEPVTCEAIWAVGAIGQAHAAAREAAATLLDRLTGLEPGAEATRLTAIAKMRFGKSAPRTNDLRRAIERALREPAFRQEETSRRRAWGLRAVEELAEIARTERAARIEADALFLGHDAIRHFVTRDDHRVRRAAESAFAAWDLPVPKVRRYFALALPELERAGGLDALLEAVRDPLGVFRHNVATRLADIGDARAVRPLAQATARLFAEPPTSTYEYDDAPPHLVAFVRALSKLNRPEGNDVLIEGLHSGNHQVRAVIAENVPDDERFVPELMAMLGDARSFVRSRAEKSLRLLGALPRAVDTRSTEIVAVRRLEG